MCIYSKASLIGVQEDLFYDFYLFQTSTEVHPSPFWEMLGTTEYEIEDLIGDELQGLAHQANQMVYQPLFWLVHIFPRLPPVFQTLQAAQRRKETLFILRKVSTTNYTKIRTGRAPRRIRRIPR